MNRFKNVINDFEETEYVEEAIHRLVEINYILGLEEEAKKYAQILGYNYNSSQWFEQSYKILNKNYEIKSDSIKDDKKGFFKKIIKMIK